MCACLTAAAKQRYRVKDDNVIEHLFGRRQRVRADRTGPVDERRHARHVVSETSGRLTEGGRQAAECRVAREM